MRNIRKRTREIVKKKKKKLLQKKKREIVKKFNITSLKNQLKGKWAYKFLGPLHDPLVHRVNWACIYLYNYI